MLILILIQFVQMWNIFGVFTVNFKQVFFLLWIHKWVGPEY